MKIFGKGLGEYFAFTKWLIVFVFVVGIVRLALSLGGVPNSTGKWASVTVAFLIGVLCFSVRVHTSGFGSYKQLLPPIWILSVATQAFVAAAIVLAIVTDKSNIFTAPEYSNGGDGRNWVHAGAHLALGATLAPLVGWLIGSLVMMVTKLVVPGKGAPAAGV